MLSMSRTVQGFDEFRDPRLSGSGSLDDNDASTDSMSRSTDSKARPIHAVRPPASRIARVNRWPAFGAALVALNLSASSFAQSPCSGIHVSIPDIKNSNGAVACALFEKPEGFPTEFLRYATHIMMMKIRNTQGRCDFLDIEPGIYALAVIHDEDMDGKIDTNWLGVPREGYGFSADAEASMGAPSFKEASFTYDGGDLELTISLNY